jgi:hypothetical protein
MHSLPGHGGCPQKQFGVRVKDAAGIRNDQAAAGAGEKFHRQGIFQRLDASAYSRLADMQGLRCAMKAAESRYCEESLNLVNFHDVPSGRFLHLKTSHYHNSLA